MRNIVTMLVLQALTAGCANTLYRPATPEERHTGIDLVGSVDADTPIRAGATSRSEVIDILGKPERACADGHAIGYSYDPITGRRGHVAFGGPCGFCGVYPIAERVHETLCLSFGDDGILSRYASSRDPIPIDWDTFCGIPATTGPTSRPAVPASGGDSPSTGSGRSTPRRT